MINWNKNIIKRHDKNKKDKENIKWIK